VNFKIAADFVNNIVSELLSTNVRMRTVPDRETSSRRGIARPANAAPGKNSFKTVVLFRYNKRSYFSAWCEPVEPGCSRSEHGILTVSERWIS